MTEIMDGGLVKYLGEVDNRAQRAEKLLQLRLRENERIHFFPFRFGFL